MGNINIAAELISHLFLIILLLKTSSLFAVSKEKSKMSSIMTPVLFTLSMICCAITLYPDTVLSLAAFILSYLLIIGALVSYHRQFSANIIISFLLTIFFDSLIFSIVQSVLGIFSESPSKTTVYSVVIVIRLFFIALLGFTERKGIHFKIKSTILAIPKYIYILLIINLIPTSGVIEALDFNAAQFEEKVLMIKIQLLFMIVSTIIIIVALIINTISKRYYSNINHILEKQIDAQILHYNQSEKINREIRAFKHDYINHTNCIKALINKGNYKEAEEYIESMSNLLPSSEKSFDTGNHIADAILSEKLSIASEYDIKILFKGCIPQSINNTDLCSVLSNILDNAIEAARKCSGEKVVEIKASVIQGYFALSASNPFSEDIKIKNNHIIETTKPDKEYHGFGLMNIEHVVKKYDGNMRISIDKNIFTIEITMKI